MLRTIKALGAQSFVYGFGGVFSKLIGFVLLPIYTRYLTPADYGIFALLGVTASVAATIAHFGLGSALFREVIYKEVNERVAISTSLYFLMGEAILLFGILTIFSPQLSALLFDTKEYVFLLQLIFLAGFLNVFEIILMAKLRIREQAKLYATLSIASFLLGTALNIYFIVVLNKGVEGLVIAGTINAFIFATLYLIFLLPDLSLKFSPFILRNMLQFGIPLVPANIAALIMTSADRYFLQHYSTAAEVGLYSLGYKIGLIINLMIQATQLAWPAQMFSIAKQADAPNQFAQILTYYLATLGFIGILLSVFAREVLIIMTSPQFYQSYTVVPLIVLSLIFYGTHFITNTGITIQNKTKYIPFIITGSAVINLIFNFLFIPNYGMIGAAWATLISYAFLLVVSTSVSLYIWYIPYEYDRIAKLMIVWIAIYVSSLLIVTSNIWLDVVLKMLLVATYPLLLYLLRFYKKREVMIFTQYLQTGIRWGRLGRYY